MQWQNCHHVLAAAAAEQFPQHDRPEIALIGRSNVGKSSLVNALTGLKQLARASNTPGRTQQIVFFDLDGQLMLADLPGYGFAKAPKAEVRHWNQLVRGYLANRRGLRCLLLLIDARHGLLAADQEMLKFLDSAAVSTQIVLTKIDQVRPANLLNETAAKVAAALKRHPAVRPEIILTSAASKTGIDELRAEIAKLANEKN